MNTPQLIDHADGVARPYHAVAVHGGVAYPCGQVPVLPDGSVPPGIADQVRVVLDNLDAVLTRVGSGRGSLLHLTVYLRDLATSPGPDCRCRRGPPCRSPDSADPSASRSLPSPPLTSPRLTNRLQLQPD